MCVCAVPPGCVSSFKKEERAFLSSKQTKDWFLFELDRCVRTGTGAAPRRTHSGTRAAGSELGRAQERRRKRALRRKDPSSSQKLASLARDAGRYRRPASSVAVRLADYHHARDTCKGFNNAFTLQAKNSIEKGPLREDVLSIGTQNSRNCRRREAAGTHGYDETAQIKMQIVVK